MSLALFVILSSTAGTTRAHAEDVLWGTDLAELIYNNSAANNLCQLWASNVHADISYHAQATNAQTGAPVCNTTIPTGREIKFQFSPHQIEDVYWFGTGFQLGSPYGDWIGGAQAAPPPLCVAKNYIYSWGVEGYSAYLDLSVNPPVKQLKNTNLLNCGSLQADGSIICTASHAGVARPVFNFASTYSIFYLAVGQGGTCSYAGPLEPYAAPSPKPNAQYANTLWSCGNTPEHKIVIPEQNIECPITIVGEDFPPTTPQPPVTESPRTPTLSAATTGKCTLGNPYSIQITAADPQEDMIRYGIDWNADGSVDEFIPSVGYIPSGTIATASRTYSLAGTKTASVLVEDQAGHASAWASLTFACPTAQNTNTNTNTNENTDTSVNGDNANTDTDPHASTTGGQNTPISISPSPDLVLRVIPSLLRSGETTRVHWSAQNVRSCNVSGSNGDSWEGLDSQIGGNSSSPIMSQVSYTLTCVDLNGATITKRATVITLPIFQET